MFFQDALQKQPLLWKYLFSFQVETEVEAAAKCHKPGLNLIAPHIPPDEELVLTAPASPWKSSFKNSVSSSVSILLGFPF